MGAGLVCGRNGSDSVKKSAEKRKKKNKTYFFKKLDKRLDICYNNIR